MFPQKGFFSLNINFFMYERLMKISTDVKTTFEVVDISIVTHRGFTLKSIRNKKSTVSYTNFTV